MICSTYYDLSEQGFANWWFLVLGLFMNLLGITLFAVGRALSRGRSDVISILLRVGGAVFCIVWTILSTYQTAIGYRQYQELLQMKREGAEQHIQGIVKNFSPYDLSKNSPAESFELDGRLFSYSPNEIRAGFRETSAKGSPVHDGAYLRIAYIGDSITKLEVCQNTSQ
jgi:hypothetical protein